MIEAERNSPTRRSMKLRCTLLFACACAFAAMATFPVLEGTAADRLWRATLEPPDAPGSTTNEMEHLLALIANPHLRISADAQQKLCDQYVRLRVAIGDADERARGKTFALRNSATSGWSLLFCTLFACAFTSLAEGVRALVSLRKSRASP